MAVRRRVPPGSPHLLRRVLGWLGWSWLALGSVVLGLRWLDLTGLVPLIQVGLSVVGASLLLLLLLSAVARAWVLAVCTALLLVPYAVLALPWWTGSPRAAGEADLVVLSANLFYGNAHLPVLEDAVTDLGVDALVLLEVTEEAQAAIAGSALPDLLPHRSATGREHALGTLVLTADPHVPIVEPTPGLVDAVPVEIHGEQGTWRLIGAHPAPPRLTGSDRWRYDLGGLAAWKDAQPSAVPLVIAGDLNSSDAHPAFREVADGMDDAHREVGAGWVRTWPATSVVPAFAHIDHVLSRRMTVVDAGTLQVAGTDHRAVWARLRLPTTP